MIEVNDECTGCMACVQACPARALSVCHGEFSFYYPRLTGSCTECGKCKAVCPKGTGSTLFDPLVVYAGIHRSHHVLQNSSSGGFFHAAAESVISSGGAVYGCAWSSENKAEHIRVDRVSDLPRLQGSKYVQSFVGSAYIEARKDLDEGREVLFSGTPCQVAGLRSYLGKDHENLLTLDLVCHGVLRSGSWIAIYRGWRTGAAADSKALSFAIRESMVGPQSARSHVKETRHTRRSFIQEIATITIFLTREMSSDRAATLASTLLQNGLAT